jgi:hypothetical protein
MRPGREPDRIGVGIWQGHDDFTPKQPIPGFDDWVRSKGGVPTEIENVLREAWQAAIEWYRTTLRTQPPPRVELPTNTIVDDDPNRVRVPRILVQRVIVTLEVTFDLPEEQQSAELLAMIAELREILE